jgi:hypothetical protein
MSRSSKSRRFSTSLESLESREVLTATSLDLLNSTNLSRLLPSRHTAKMAQSENPSLLKPGSGNYQARPRRITSNQRLIDQVNNSFTSFQNDYLPVLSIYLNNAVDENSADAMKSYLSQRTKLLSQELTRTLVLVPGFASKQKNGGVPLMTFLDRKILGSINAQNPNGNQQLSLYDSLANLIPAKAPSPGTEPIYTSGAINAIQAANAATINAMGYAAFNTFGKPLNS